MVSVGISSLIVFEDWDKGKVPNRLAQSVDPSARHGDVDHGEAAGDLLNRVELTSLRS
jgi:hypothetical protein